MEPLTEPIAAKRDRLLAVLRKCGSCAVAYSGGVDSSVVAKAARLALGDAAVAVTGVSASLADGEMECARKLAESIGLRHVVLTTGEVADPAYAANAPDRCFHCKNELYKQLRGVAERFELAELVNGTNADDLSDYRPGTDAAATYGVRSPLAECGLTKAEVRQLAEHWHLPVADKPATPCLSSRIAYGQEVTPERLRMIDRAEQVFHKLGVQTVRVRYHAGDLARVEVPPAEIAELCQPAIRDFLAAELKQLGFRYATIDLEGFRSGSLNEMILEG